ncbi:MAG: hypothetical protein KJP18_04150 [Gemmatimonadetes bacterium]|nr:hypothetical protein [Gemmatimonadota bacterium]
MSVHESSRGWLSHAVGCLLLLVALPAPAAAQYGFLGSLGNRFSDLSFFAELGRLDSDDAGIVGDGVRVFGMEILFTVGTVERQVAPARVPDDSVRLVWRESRVERTSEGVDTVDIYDVVRVQSPARMETVWSFELGLGYGQLTGFDTAAEGLELKGAVRNLPAVSLYASYENFGTYFGVRSGLMEFSGLQLVDGDGGSWKGSGKSFLTGLLVGQAWSVAELNFFVEAGYTIRDFPSVEWSGSPPPEAPRAIDVSGWSLGTGIQFGIGN